MRGKGERKGGEMVGKDIMAANGEGSLYLFMHNRWLVQSEKLQSTI